MATAMMSAEAVGSAGIQAMPLTPALSPRERGNRQPLISLGKLRDLPPALPSRSGEENWFKQFRQTTAGALVMALVALTTPVNATEPTTLGWHKLQVSDRGLGQQITASGGRLIADYGSYQLFAAPEVPSELQSHPALESRDEYNLILLNTGNLDTTAAQAQAARKALGQFSAKRLHLIQFSGPVQPAWWSDLANAGVQVVTYIPHNAYLLYGDAPALARVQALANSAPHVQWDGEFLAAYKIHPNALAVDSQGNPREIGTTDFAVQLVADAAANPATLNLIDQLKLAPVRRQDTALSYVNVIVSLAPGSLAAIAAQPDVVSIQAYLPRQELDERQDQIVAGNLNNNSPSGPGYMTWLASKGFTQAQFTTSGFAADVTDSGLDNGTQTPNHAGLFVQGNTANPSRVIYNRLEGSPGPGSTIKGCDGHGTLNSHVIGGYDNTAGFPHTDAANYHFGLGVCPFVKLGSSVIFDPSFTFPTYSSLQSKAYNDGARVSNNSWGANTQGAYDTDAQQYDALVRDAQPGGSPFPASGNQEMVIVFANGNAGPGGQTVGAPACAKNVISVGAAENVQPFGGPDGCGVSDSGANSANDIISFSSRGPCADGRHKPDLTAPGTHVSGGVAQADSPAANGTADPCFSASGVCAMPASNFYPPGQELFTVSSGTSHSAPAVVGGCALLRQYFINTFSNPPSPAMTKAYLMNSARYMTGTGAGDNLWSDTQGMGEMNLGMAFDNARRILRDELTNDLFTASGQSVTFGGSVIDTNKAFRVTVAWTDSPGSTVGNAYHNNLDLSVTVAGNTYKGNVFRGAYSTTGGAADLKNNVESVFLPAGTTGAFTATITAVSINSDGVPHNGIPLDQDFALVIYNAQPPPPTINSLTPTNLNVLAGLPASFSVSASGDPPLSYQWRKDTVPIPGATTSTYTIAAAGVTDAGAYSVMVTNVNGPSISADATLSVIPTVPLPYALNNSNLAWQTDASIPWFGQTNLVHDNVAAAHSYFIGDGTNTTLSTSTNGPATLTFWWKVSSETNADILSFADLAPTSTNVISISGEVNWTQQTIYLAAGPQTLQWTYGKDGANSAGSDAGWVDQVVFTPGATRPFIVTQPASQNVSAGQPAIFVVSAGGTPDLTYQWQLNGMNLPGATGSSFVIASPAGADAGAYTVGVTNDYGGVLSAPGYLQVVPIMAVGDDTYNQAVIPPVATNAVSVGAGAWHSLVLRQDGTVVAWGESSRGQCTVPAGLANAIAIAGGGYHSLALKSDGTVVCWGDNTSGQVTPPARLSNLTAIAAGTWHSVALKSDGTVVGWGDNSSGQISIPAGLTNVSAIAAGGNHSLALKTDGTVVAWGDNMDASGNFAGQSVVPLGLSRVIAIGAGDYHSLAALEDGTVVAWGDNSQGQVGPPTGLGPVAFLAGGGAHTVSLEADGSVAAWGNNWNNQCALPSNVTNAIAVAAGNSHTLMLVGRIAVYPQILQATRSGKQFNVLVQTYAGKNYALEYRSSLNSGAWTTLPTVHGTGAMLFLTDLVATGPQRFYRVKQW